MQLKRGKNSDFSVDFNSLKTNFNKLKENYDISDKELINLLKEETYFIPASVFSTKLSSLETITKYLKEEQGLNFSKIALLLNRNPRTIWGSYSSSVKSLKERFKTEKSEFFIPTNVFVNRKFSVLESIVVHLREKYCLSYHKIALLLKRNDRTIWTVYSRARKKNAK